VMRPFRSLLMIASSDDSMIAARCAVAAIRLGGSDGVMQLVSARYHIGRFTSVKSRTLRRDPSSLTCRATQATSTRLTQNAYRLEPIAVLCCWTSTCGRRGAQLLW
jgi:hypothetical protein